jgi:hypothetical protein
MSTNEVNFQIAKKIPPAFAGVLVDWKIGPREITATLVDLIVKGNLVTSGEKLFKGRRKATFGFEKRFIDEVFENKESLSFEEVKKQAYGTKSTKLIKIICDGMVEEGIVVKDFQKKMASFVGNSLKSFVPNEQLKESLRESMKHSSSKRPVVIPSGIAKMILLLGAIFAAVFLGIWAFSSSLLIKGISFTLFWIILMFILFPAIIVALISKKIEHDVPDSREIMLTKKGYGDYGEMIKLRKFMEKYPLLEDRLANELVAHAIAFGIGKTWMKKLGGFASYKKIVWEFVSSEGDTNSNFINYDTYLKDVYESLAKGG